MADPRGVVITFKFVQVNPQRIEVRDATGVIVSAVDVPSGCLACVVRSPWHVRLRWWFRALPVRVRLLWHGQ